MGAGLCGQAEYVETYVGAVDAHTSVWGTWSNPRPKRVPSG